MIKAPRWPLVQEKLAALRGSILGRFHDIEVECVSRSELVKDHGKLSRDRGYPAPGPDVQGYILIYGNPTSIEEAATFADNEVSDIWEETGIVIEVRASNKLWCRKSAPFSQSGPISEFGGFTQSPTSPYDFFKSPKGTEFWCRREAGQPTHQHDFGNLQLEYQASLR